jgi:hypothetical protein
MNRRALLILSAAMLAGSLTGCGGGRFARPYYDTIYIDQPADDVRQALGRPQSETPDYWTYTHERPYYKAVIFFRNGRVVGKKWFSQRTPEGDGGDKPLPEP